MSFFSKAVKSVSGSSGSGAAQAVGNVTIQDHALLQVERKLRKLEKYKELDGRELQELVESITSPEMIINNFSHLVEHTLVSNARNHPQESKTKPLEEIKPRYIQVAKTLLKIVVHNFEANPNSHLLHSLGDFIRMDYGTQQVSLVVGDIVLEWGRDNLVIPKSEDLPDDSAPVDSYDTPSLTVVQQMVERTSTEKPIFEELAELISKYNKKFYYVAAGRNSQTFVKDALIALGITETIPVASETIERMVQLKQKKIREIPDNFAQHEDLDKFIKTKSQYWIKHLDHDSLEFLQLSYEQFHGSAPCYNPNCQVSILLDALQQHTS